MFLIDDVLFAPGKAAYVLFQQIARKAQEEWLNDDTIKQELQELYGLLESGRISEKDFEASECRLLERLEQIARVKFQDKWGNGETPVIDAAAIGAAPIAVAPIDVVPIAAPPPPAPHPAPLPSQSALPPAFALPLPPPAPAAPPPLRPADPTPQGLPPRADGALSIGQVMDCAVRALAMLKMRVSTITSVVPEQSNWKVSVELVERRGIPDTNDVLGLYELWLDGGGNVLRYERTLMRRRCDFAR